MKEILTLTQPKTAIKIKKETNYLLFCISCSSYIASTKTNPDSSFDSYILMLVRALAHTSLAGTCNHKLELIDLRLGLSSKFPSLIKESVH